MSPRRDLGAHLGAKTIPPDVTDSAAPVPGSSPDGPRVVGAESYSDPPCGVGGSEQIHRKR